MYCFRPGLMGLALVLVTASVLPSCRNKKEAVGSDLGEAGFELTTTDWFRASRENNPEILKKFLSGGFSQDTRDDSGNTALHAAAEVGAENSAKYLLDRGIPIDVVGGSQRTPLMVAVIANKPTMVRWLLRQGADPKAKDAENYKALMLAVREGSSASAAELAAYDRESLDSALLMAALLGRKEVIDSLTNYGASVYARMEDGRTPLMIAAENGHLEAVELLLDIGSSRYATDAEGKTAAMLAQGAGKEEIVKLINREPSADELVLESPEQVAAEMEEFVAAAEGEIVEGATEGAVGEPSAGGPSPAGTPSVRPLPRPIEGAVLHVESKDPAPASLSPRKSDLSASAPVIMRHYREADVPIEVAAVKGDTATLRISGPSVRQVTVKSGEVIAGSRLMVAKVQRRMENSKLTDGKLMEISVVEVSDRTSGTKREWISGRPSTAHDPIALVEDPITGARYTATPGQRFKSAEGIDYVITDVRPNQIVIENVSAGTVQTIPLKGPRG
jgi:ankyrin repeat protein